MNNFKIIITAILLIGNSEILYAFDLKALTDKLQKDIGSQLQVPKGDGSSGNSNPLGGLLNNSGSSPLNMSNMSQTNSSSSLVSAQGICDPKTPQLLKNLPKGNVSNLKNDFNNKSSTEIKLLLNTSPMRLDRFVENLEVYDGAFETKEVEKVFASFLKSKSLEDLATLKALSGLEGGFSQNKKQIKVDAQFAYGLIHYFYYKNGSNKELGIDLIRQSANSNPDSIGGLSLYGAWQFFGINVNQNIQAGNSNALKGYNKAFDKNRETMVSGPFYRMTKSKYPEKIFLEIAGNDKNPYKTQYQNQLAQASQMKQQVMNDIQKSEVYASGKSWYPYFIQAQDITQKILLDLDDNMGLGSNLADLKAEYMSLNSKVDKDNSLVERKVIINQRMKDIVIKALAKKDATEKKGKEQITDLDHDNQLVVLKMDELIKVTSMTIMVSGGFNSSEIKSLDMIGKAAGTSCDVYFGIQNYAKRINVPELKQLTSIQTPPKKSRIGKKAR